ncbi:uncharacterized protein LOC132029650 [Lycium ferocissimum]|uniref:uncharacterized protein LOC132029650 n=1 Tax=Lycium ferocissimum TaxID=112874 RepID=UPI0028161184|nr:uncharacterized protein LOC132029650 [Lycium ferocissimum]XP_059274936.1 uncharacterized protein LOC132029650 [Lycium ferocissimum]XP_059274938.1 uncharacterized protein LOC132029650 [Lycium ferocissimum]XP_059274939.1 uncharacterized protein LOC132029650 [Lycium ferocissimum]XP_059274940.1 uncharacterized protein LOC132029650 [Lycium ferocissimum]XP_059274941.1 uncharacterized protein LOC132029650 [Lycium ferocissimum]
MTQMPWIVLFISAKAELPWRTNLKAPIYKRELSLEAKFWWTIIHTRIHPTQFDNTLTPDRAVLLVAIMSKYNIDLGLLIAEEIRLRVLQPQTSLIFPCLITRLCERADIPKLKTRDKYTKAVHVSDIMKSKDEMLKEERLKAAQSTANPFATSVPVQPGSQDEPLPNTTIDFENAANIEVPPTTSGSATTAAPSTSQPETSSAGPIPPTAQPSPAAPPSGRVVTLSVETFRDYMAKTDRANE